MNSNNIMNLQNSTKPLNNDSYKFIFDDNEINSVENKDNTTNNIGSLNNSNVDNNNYVFKGTQKENNINNNFINISNTKNNKNSNLMNNNDINNNLSSGNIVSNKVSKTNNIKNKKFLVIKKNLNLKIDTLKKKILDFEKRVIDNNYNFNYREIINVEKNILKLFLFINKIKLEYNINLKQELLKLNEINYIINIINKFKSNIVDTETNSSINILTIINLIFYPLSIIVGYFGMNFGSMGSPAGKTGIFSIKHGQLWVILLFILSSMCVLTLIVYFFPHLRKMLNLKKQNNNY